MQKKLTAPRIFTGVLLLFLITIAVCALVIPSLGFFQAWFRATGFNSAKVELIFDRLDFTSTNVQNYRDPNDANFRFDSTAEWGTKANPYVISQKYHVQNLSVLQNNGFFKEKKDANDQPLQSYFRVCNKNGTPVAINCEGMKLAPVGTHKNPFTGVVEGALVTGEATYTYTPRSSSDTVARQSYGVSVSTIGNLIVEASVSEPDIGFFGCISYHGTCTIDPTGKNPPTVSNGYAANVQNILLADVTVSSTVTIADQLSTWWAKFKWNVGTTDETEHTHDTYETHHIGVVAGHAEFATVNNISVFYTNGVETYKLAGATNTNYYSTTGLIGMLRYVNPTIQSGGTLVGDGNSVSDGDMVEGGLGGGGTISGTLTGYMLAETLFSEHEKYLTKQSLGKKNVYDVTEMKKSDGSQLFETVQMQEGTGSAKQTVTYYYFKDSVFTFAMSASSANNTAGLVDYVQKIWELEDEGKQPNLYATNSANKWQITTDPSATPRIAYKLTAVETPSEMVNSDSNGSYYYVLAYYDQTSRKTYIFDINNANSGYCMELDGDSVYAPSDQNAYAPTTFSDGSYKTVWLTSSTTKYYTYAFEYKPSYDTSATISNPAGGEYRLAVHLEREEELWGALAGEYKAPVLEITNGRDAEGGLIGQKFHIFEYDWVFTNSYITTAEDGTETTHYLDNGKMVVYNSFSYNGTLYDAYGYCRFKFDSVNKFALTSFDSEFSRSNSSYASRAYDQSGWTNGNYLTVYKLEANVINSSGLSVEGENVELTPTNMVPAKKDANGNLQYDAAGNLLLDTAYSFDPSKYVLENAGNGTYKLAPISSYNLNNGKGKKVEQLNHVVKMARAVATNFQFDLPWDLGFINSLVSSNSGGVVSAEIGTTGRSYTIPAGMIAFYIDEEVTNADNPSYINIIVAVNPEQYFDSKVGLWDTSKFGSGASVNFDLTKPDQSFVLPKSVTGSVSADSQYIITVSDYVTQKFNTDGTPVLDASGKPVYASSGGTSYVYLGGEVAFVYHSFQVTKGGIYLLGSCAGPLSVSYFSVSGAAGQGADGTSTSPLGDIDFVYANGGKIVTIDQKFTGMHDPTDENYALYYPSYHFVVMKGEGTTAKPFVQNEIIKVHRYIDPNDTIGTKRHIKIIGCSNAEAKGLADVYEDDLEE